MGSNYQQDREIAGTVDQLAPRPGFTPWSGGAAHGALLRALELAGAPLEAPAPQTAASLRELAALARNVSIGGHSLADRVQRAIGSTVERARELEREAPADDTAAACSRCGAPALEI